MNGTKFTKRGKGFDTYCTRCLLDAVFDPICGRSYLFKAKYVRFLRIAPFIVQVSFIRDQCRQTRNRLRALRQFFRSNQLGFTRSSVFRLPVRVDAPPGRDRIDTARPAWSSCLRDETSSRRDEGERNTRANQPTCYTFFPHAALILQRVSLRKNHNTITLYTRCVLVS